MTATFVVNLKKDVQRLAWFKEEMLAKWPNGTFEVVDAVVGKDVPDEEVKRIVNMEKAQKILGREMGRGEIGVVLSMQKIFARMISENIPVALIFEDDARLSVRLKDVVPQLEQWLLRRKGATVLLLSEANRVRKWAGESLASTGVSVCRPLTIYGAYGYLINLAGAKAMLSYNTPIFRCSDMWSDYQKDGVVEVFSAVPHLVGNNDFSRKASNLSQERRDLWAQAKHDSLGFWKLLASYCADYLCRVSDLVTGVTVISERTNDGL